MGGKQGRGNIIISTEHSTTVAGQPFNCTAYLVLNDKIKSPSLTITFKGKEEAKFQGDGTKRGKNVIIEFAHSLLDPNLSLLNPGSYVFPFTLHLPNDLPGTFKAKMKRFDAKIEYEVKAELLERREFICKNKAAVVVEQVLESNRQSVLKTQSSYVICCDCFNKGVCNISAHIDKHAFLPEETARLWMEIDNSKVSRRLNNIGVSLFRVIRLISNDRQVGLFKKRIYSKTLEVNIQSRGKPLKDKEICVDIPLNAVGSNTEECVTTVGKIIQCKYYIQISSDFGNCISRDVEFEIPLIIGPRAVEVTPPSAPEDWNPIEMPNTNISVNSQNMSIIDRSSLNNQ